MERSMQFVDQKETSVFYKLESKRYMELNLNQSQQLTD